MHNSHKALLLSASAFLSVLVAAPAIAEVAVIDRDKVVSGYSKAQQAFDDLKKGEEKVQKLVENANKQYEEAKKANKPPAELEGLQRRLQTEIDSEVKKLQGRIQSIEASLESEIDGAIKAEAAGHKVDVVLMKQAVLFGGVDITDGVLKRLAATSAPAAKK